MHRFLYVIYWNLIKIISTVWKLNLKFFIFSMQIINSHKKICFPKVWIHRVHRYLFQRPTRLIQIDRQHSPWYQRRHPIKIQILMSTIAIITFTLIRVALATRIQENTHWVKIMKPICSTIESFGFIMREFSPSQLNPYF